MRGSSHRQPGAAQRGQGLSEYAIILVGIAIICLAIVVIFGGRIAALFGFAHDEVDSMGEAEFAGFDGPIEDSDHSGSGSDGSGSDGSGSDGGDAGDDGWGDSGGGGRGSDGGSSRSGSSRGSGKRGADAGGDERLIKPSERAQRGTYKLGEGDDEVTVVAAREGADGRGGRGSAAWDKRREGDSQARTRAADQERWQKRRRDRIEEEEAAAAAASKGPGFLGMVRFLLIGVLVVGVLFVGRTVLAGSGGTKGGGGD